MMDRVDWIHLAHGTCHRQPLVNMLKGLRVPQIGGNITLR